MPKSRSVTSIRNPKLWRRSRLCSFYCYPLATPIRIAPIDDRRGGLHPPELLRRRDLHVHDPHLPVFGICLCSAFACVRHLPVFGIWLCSSFACVRHLPVSGHLPAFVGRGHWTGRVQRAPTICLID